MYAKLFYKIFIKKEKVAWPFILYFIDLCIKM